MWLAGLVTTSRIALLTGALALAGVGVRLLLQRRARPRPELEPPGGPCWHQDPARYSPSPQDWPLAASAMYALDHGFCWDRVELGLDTAQQVLDGWGITSSEGLREEMDWLRFCGQRVLALRDGRTEADYHAFDWVWLILLARAGFTAQLISVEEMQTGFNDAQTVLQARYSSWAELGETWMAGCAAYLAARDGTALSEHLRHLGPQLRLLQTPPRGPWARVPWQ